MTDVPKTWNAFRAACQPTRPLHKCAQCTKIGGSCSRFEKGGDLVRDSIPPNLNLEGFIPAIPYWRGEILRCPTCHRMYWYETEYEFLIGGSEDTISYSLMTPEEVFRSAWFLKHRLGPERVEDACEQDYLPSYSIAKLKDGSWIALHHEGAILELDPAQGLDQVIAIEPPFNLEDPTNASMYLNLVQAMRGTPTAHPIQNFDHIPWKWDLTPGEKAQIEDLRAASRVQRERRETLADRVMFTRWIVLDRKLICRAVSVFPDGRILYEDAVIGEDLPLRT